ncbi:hypothetical protein [Mycobacterium sp. OTB74]|uniref:hypothetical protein n=1 Tax=Mycobacterium sp. OTB74 TaxID=1853452 RepID=UPI002475A95A|nr:hypothetical protein [Mycobacterium sp. OTB74]MDH6242931.1 hypothetical protein [Mycobacterium sp. OTB74]
MITKWHEAPVDAAVIDEQAVTVLTYVNGVMMTFVHGFPVVSDADQLDRRIQAILRSVDGR